MYVRKQLHLKYICSVLVLFVCDLQLCTRCIVDVVFIPKRSFRVIAFDAYDI
jgi:hypothetical protein